MSCSISVSLCLYNVVFTAFYDELQKLGCVLQFVRSGRLALTKSCVERVNEFLADREARYLKSKQTE